jgi:formylglycine-generating enzyme required for sulfatase activity
MKYFFLYAIIVFSSISGISKDIKYPNNFYMPKIVDGRILKGSKPILGTYLYMKETEVSNQEYKIFLRWAKRIDKSFYNLAYPDTNVWGKGFEAFKSNYFQSNTFLNMPMLGVSQKQAKLYCSWLQDNYNEYFSTNSDSKIKKVIVRLPSEIEWIMAAEGGQKPGANFPWACEGVRYSGPDKRHLGKFLLNCKMGTISYETFQPYNTMITTEVYSYWPNAYGLYNMSGNVAEWLEEEGLSKGGSWNTTPYNCRINYVAQYSKDGAASSHIGFRYVIEVVETYDDKTIPKFEIQNKMNSNGFEYIPKQNNSDNLKFMSNEISNLEYKQFLIENNDSILKPKAGIWKPFFRYIYFEQYAWHSAFNNFPVVGITYESALAYCKWLGQKYNSNPKREYQKVVFRLPNESEWMHAAYGGYKNLYGWGGSYTRNSRGCYLANFAPLEDQYLYQDSNNIYSWVNNNGIAMSKTADGALIPHFTTSYFPNNYGMYNCSGNVAEMIEEKGTSKGGSWVSTQYDIMLISKEKYREPNATLGFRVLAEVIER